MYHATPVPRHASATLRWLHYTNLRYLFVSYSNLRNETKKQDSGSGKDSRVTMQCNWNSRARHQLDEEPWRTWQEKNSTASKRQPVHQRYTNDRCWAIRLYRHHRRGLKGNQSDSSGIRYGTDMWSSFFFFFTGKAFLLEHSHYLQYYNNYKYKKYYL